MPILQGYYNIGSYYRYGNRKKYYYNPLDINNKFIAYFHALRQARAIYASKRRNKK